MTRRSTWFGCWLALWLFMLATPLAAANESMYRAAVPVKSQSSGERTRAAAEGLRQVLVRVSGVVDLQSAGDVSGILSDASRYIDQFHYKRATDEYGDQVEQLVMSFSPTVVERLLRQAGLPLWPTNRPQVLVWLVEDHAEHGRRLINEGESEVVRGLRKGAALRGLNLKWPLLDLDDQLAINAEDAWTFEQGAVLEASERYRVDAILVGRYTQTSQGEWWTSWQFFHRGESRSFEWRLEDGIAAGAQAIDVVADELASRYSVASGAEGAPRMLVQISSVDDFGEYRGAIEYLRQVAVVSSLELLEVSGSTLLVAVSLEGDVQQLQNAISLDQKLRPVSDAVSAVSTALPQGPGAVAELRLEWIGR